MVHAGRRDMRSSFDRLFQEISPGAESTACCKVIIKCMGIASGDGEPRWRCNEAVVSAKRTTPLLIVVRPTHRLAFRLLGYILLSGCVLRRMRGECRTSTILVCITTDMGR